MVDFTLFDKYINIHFMKTKESGKIEGNALGQGGLVDSMTDTVIRTPLTGMKPNITIKGTFLPSYGLASPEIRITNFYPDRDLNDYKYIMVEAGYIGSMSTAFIANMLEFSPFVEKPSPDGILAILCAIGDYERVVSTTLSKTWEVGSSVRAMLQIIAGELGLYLDFNVPDVALEEKVIVAGRIVDLIPKLKDILPDAIITLDSNRLRIYTTQQGTTVRFKPSHISMATKKGQALTIIAPWIPELRPGDILELEPAFYKQSIGSTLLKFKSNDFVVISIDFAFSTTDQNSMIVLALNKE